MSLQEADDLATGWIAHAGPAHVREPDVHEAERAPPLPPGADSRTRLHLEWLSARRRLERARESRDPAQLSRALDAVDTLLGAMDAADALERLQQQADHPPPASLDRLEPDTWLLSAWLDVEPLAKARGVSARLKVHAEQGSLGAVYGRGDWLRRLLRECLESAVHGAKAHETLAIDYRQSGPRALIVLSRSRAFRHEHDSLRLALCQRIAAWHGGELRLECDDGQRDWLIDLPTGAPFHAEQTELDVDQAQRFARELHALQARARQRQHPATQDIAPHAGDLP